MNKIMDWLERNAKIVLIVGILINISYATWMYSRGNAVWVVNIASALYCAYVAGRWWRYM